MVEVHDVITPFKFGGDRFRGFWLAEGQGLLFPIDFEGRPYNTHTIVWGMIIRCSEFVFMTVGLLMVLVAYSAIDLHRII